MARLCTMRLVPAKSLDMHRTVDQILLVGQSIHVVDKDERCLQVYSLKVKDPVAYFFRKILYDDYIKLLLIILSS